MSSLFRVKSQITGEREPQVIASGLTYEEALKKARAAFDHTLGSFRGPFELTIAAGSYEAKREAWGFSYYVEAEIKVTPEDLLGAFRTLEKVIELEGGDPGRDSFRLSSIEADLMGILSGRITLEPAYC